MSGKAWIKTSKGRSVKIFVKGKCTLRQSGWYISLKVFKSDYKQVIIVCKISKSIVIVLFMVIDFYVSTLSIIKKLNRIQKALSNDNNLYK